MTIYKSSPFSFLVWQGGERSPSRKRTWGFFIGGETSEKWSWLTRWLPRASGQCQLVPYWHVLKVNSISFSQQLLLLTWLNVCCSLSLHNQQEAQAASRENWRGLSFPLSLGFCHFQRLLLDLLPRRNRVQLWLKNSFFLDIISISECMYFL